MSELIETLSRASDAQGYPFLLGFMEKYGLMGLLPCFEDTDRYVPLAAEYIRQEGLA